MSEATIVGSVYRTERGFEAVMWLEHYGQQTDCEVYGSGLTAQEAVVSAAAGVNYAPVEAKPDMVGKGKLNGLAE